MPWNNLDPMTGVVTPPNGFFGAPGAGAFSDLTPGGAGAAGGASTPITPPQSGGAGGGAPAAPPPPQGAPVPMPGGNPNAPPVPQPAPATTPWNALPPDVQAAVQAAYQAAGSPGGPFGFMDWYTAGNYSPAAGGGTGGVPQPPVPLGGQLTDLLGGRFPGMPPAFSGTDPKGQSLFSFLPGRAGEAEGIGQFLANWLAGQAQEQRPRSDERENLFRAIQGLGADSPSMGLADRASTLARQRIAPGALQGYESDLRTQAASDAGQGAQRSMQMLRDQGFMGRGASGIDPSLAASNLANQGLSQRNLDISALMEQIAGQRLGQAGDLSRSGAAVTQGLQFEPGYNLANALGTQKYGGDQPLLQLLQDMMYTSIQGDQASRSAPNNFERYAMPIMSTIVSGSPFSSGGGYGSGGGGQQSSGGGQSSDGFMSTLQFS